MRTRPTLALALLALLAAGCGGEATPATPAPPAWAADWQRKVDDLRTLQKAQTLPEGLLGADGRLDGTEFDVEEYFGILGHIDAEPGFVLDFVYRETADRGFPILYVHRADEPGYATYEEYRTAAGSEPLGQGEDTSYLDQVYVVDGTHEGFFEYVVLQVMGGQFYLYWHAQQDDALVVATRERLDEVLAPVAGQMDEAALEKARTVDPTPVVSFDGDLATVEILVFTRWGGLARHTYTIERTFPQQILEMQVETVAVCECAIAF